MAPPPKFVAPTPAKKRPDPGPSTSTRPRLRPLPNTLPSRSPSPPPPASQQPPPGTVRRGVPKFTQKPIKQSRSPSPGITPARAPPSTQQRRNVPSFSRTPASTRVKATSVNAPLPATPTPQSHHHVSRPLFRSTQTPVLKTPVTAKTSKTPSFQAPVATQIYTPTSAPIPSRPAFLATQRSPPTAGDAIDVSDSQETLSRKRRRVTPIYSPSPTPSPPRPLHSPPPPSPPPSSQFSSERIHRTLSGQPPSSPTSSPLCRATPTAPALTAALKLQAGLDDDNDKVLSPTQTRGRALKTLPFELAQSLLPPPETPRKAPLAMRLRQLIATADSGGPGLLPTDWSPTKIKKKDRRYITGGLAATMAGWVMELKAVKGLGRRREVEVLEWKAGAGEGWVGVRGMEGEGWILMGGGRRMADDAEDEYMVGRRVRVEWPWWEIDLGSEEAAQEGMVGGFWKVGVVWEVLAEEPQVKTAMEEEAEMYEMLYKMEAGHGA